MAFINFLKPKNTLEEGGRAGAPVRQDAGEPEKTCPNCRKAIPLSKLWANDLVCPCGYHFRMKARQRIKLVADKESFRELFSDIRSCNPLDFPGYTEKVETVTDASGEAEAVACGTASIDEIPCALFIMEPYFMMGSMGSAEEQDRERLRGFLREFYQRRLQRTDGRPPQITYRAMSSTEGYKTYTGIFLKMDSDVSLYCCRRTPDAMESAPMQELAMRFTEGVVAFEVENDTVKPLYTSENVCSFFDYSREAWIALVEKRPTIREFIAQSGIDYAAVKTLFATGEAEFTYFDITQKAYRRIRAICSQNYNGDGKCYVMLYNLDAKEPEGLAPKVRIRTFGYFDVFVDDKPIAFRNEKSRELLALLVDRRGGFVSSEEAISFLWEDEPANSVTLARYRKVALRLKNILDEYGISEIMESVNGKRRIAAEKIQCDLYDYLTGRDEFAQLFKGSYLTNYSWGENTLAELTGDHLYGTGA